ncbi:hypothetical protein HGG70_05290 [Rhodobacteraceae bacterium R_SAG4]|nr:hypothetical protein [Rhodobacteraceae bacterium R_SAG4]
MLCTTTEFQPIGRINAPWNTRERPHYIEVTEIGSLSCDLHVAGTPDRFDFGNSTHRLFPVTFHQINKRLEPTSSLRSQIADSSAAAVAQLAFGGHLSEFLQDELTEFVRFQDPISGDCVVSMRTPVVACTLEQSEEMFDLEVFTPF